jgi:phosphatidylglycerophosphate synthase
MTTVTLSRENGALLASVEKRVLVWMAERMPRAITSDHLTALALLAMAVTGAGFALSRWDTRALWLVVPGLVLNWFGDSLDGTLARVRKAERPRYGFYVDHVLDLAGATCLLGGLALSPFMSPVVALAVLVGYLLATGEVFLATAAHGVFRMSFAGVGPTELRMLLAVGAIALFGDPHVSLGPLGDARLFDVGGVIAAAGLVAAVTVSTLRNTAALAKAEPPRQ